MEKVFIENVKKARFFEKSIGLMGKKKPYPLLFCTRWGIHTFGLKFPIDVVITNDANKVVVIKRNILPSRLFFWNPLFKNVLELPEGTIDKKRIHIGCTITYS